MQLGRADPQCDTALGAPTLQPPDTHTHTRPQDNVSQPLPGGPVGPCHQSQVKTAFGNRNWCRLTSLS